MKPVFIYALLDPLTGEIRYLGQTLDPDCWLRENVSDGGHTPMRGKKHSEGAKAKISAAKFGKISPETKAKLSIASSGRKHSPETKAKISAAHIGKKKANNTSGFVGISWHGGKWEARYQFRGKRTHIGLFHKIEDAVFARTLAIAIQ